MGEITVDNNRYKSYIFTIKSLGDEMDGEYGDFLTKLKKYNIHVHYKYGERDPKGKFHYHGLLDLPNGFFRKKLVTKGNNLHLREFIPGDSWENYCKKDQDKPTKSLFK